MKILLLGPPGAGKGTIAEHLVNEYGYTLLSTGHMLRTAIANKTELGLAAQAIMDSGKLVSDAIMLDLVEAFLEEHKTAKGIIFDGFPRTLVQAKAMSERNLAFDHVIYLKVDDAVIVRRMSGRRVHPESGRVYHVENNPPKVSGQDDVTGEPLIIRADDKEAVVRQRLAVYQELTAPLVEYYQAKANFQMVDASQAVSKVISNLSI